MQDGCQELQGSHLVLSRPSKSLELHTLSRLHASPINLAITGPESWTCTLHEANQACPRHEVGSCLPDRRGQGAGDLLAKEIQALCYRKKRKRVVMARILRLPSFYSAPSLCLLQNPPFFCFSLRVGGRGS